MDITKNVTTMELAGHTIRVANLDGKPWFFRNDIAKMCGYSNASDATAKIRQYTQIADYHSGRPGNPNVSIINEAGMMQMFNYATRKKETEMFRKWVNETVLPNFGKTAALATKNETLPATQESASLPSVVDGVSNKVLPPLRMIWKQNQDIMTKMDSIMKYMSCVHAANQVSTMTWRSAANYVAKHASKAHGLSTQDIWTEMYGILEKDMSANLNIRVKNIYKRTGHRVSKLEAIAQDKDKRLVPYFIQIIKQTAVKYGIEVKIQLTESSEGNEADNVIPMRRSA